MATLAQKLKKARVAQNLLMSQTAYISIKKYGGDARRMITQGYISRLESGKETNPSFLKIKTLCMIYKIEPGSLF